MKRFKKPCNWNIKEKTIVVKNLLLNRTCKDCVHENECNIIKLVKHNTCFKYKKAWTLKVASYPIKLKTRKLKCKWTVEVEQQLKAYHGLPIDEEK